MFEYVLMKYNVTTSYELTSNYIFTNTLPTKEELYPLFTECFETGDAEFYHKLPYSERETYFNEQLGFPEVLSHPASQVVYYEDQLVGFALCMDYLKDNIHISCMCVLPEFQSKGIGRLMLEYIESWSTLNDIATITLGTESKMKAFQLYKDFGFKVTETHIVE